jgi:coproporphyrinogen III oxidase-like Fe-S oxidoreductase
MDFLDANGMTKDLQRAVNLKPRHISAYNLTFEKDTPLGDKLLAKLLD